MPCGHVSSLVEGAIIGANQTFLTWTGYRREELIPAKKFCDLLTVPGQIFYETQFAPLLQMQGFVKGVAFDLVRTNRQPLPVLVNSTLVAAKDGRPAFIRSLFFDATDRRRYESELLLARRNLAEQVKLRTAELEKEIVHRTRAEASLQDLTLRLLKLQDDERRRLARELHDSVGQILSAVSMNLGFLSRKANHLEEPVRARVAETSELIQEALKEIRVVSHLLHPPLLDEMGLAAALRTYIEGFSNRAKVQVALTIEENFGRLPQDLETGIFRIVQESLTNIHRHAESATASVSVLRSREQVQIIVQDRGKGIPESVDHGVGLRGMRERVAQFGGLLEIETSSSGTTITSTFPING